MREARLREVQNELGRFSGLYPGSHFRVEQEEVGFPKVYRLDCPSFTEVIVSPTQLRNMPSKKLRQHHKSEDHLERRTLRITRINTVRARLGLTQKKHPGSEYTLHVDSDGLKPRITCSACPNWNHLMPMGESSSIAIQAVISHADSEAHNKKINPTPRPGINTSGVKKERPAKRKFDDIATTSYTNVCFSSC